MINKSNIIDLNSYIRITSIKEQFEESYLYVSTDDDFLKINKYQNIVFENSQIKTAFFNELIKKDVNHTVINCLSSVDIFEESLYNAHGLVVFDNVCSCRNNEILEKVIEYKNSKMLVC